MHQLNLSNEADFALFFDTYKEQVYGYVLTFVKLPDVAEELTQDVFMKLWTCRDILYEIKNIDNYMFVLSRNRSLNYLRKVKSDQKILEEIKKHISDQHHHLDEYILTRDYEQLLSEALANLSSQRRVVYQLSREEGLSMAEIAERLELSPNTVKNHLVASLKSIRLFLEQHGDIATILTIFLFV